MYVYKTEGEYLQHFKQPLLSSLLTLFLLQVILGSTYPTWKIWWHIPSCKRPSSTSRNSVTLLSYWICSTPARYVCLFIIFYSSHPLSFYSSNSYFCPRHRVLFLRRYLFKRLRSWVLVLWICTIQSPRTPQPPHPCMSVALPCAPLSRTNRWEEHHLLPSSTYNFFETIFRVLLLHRRFWRIWRWHHGRLINFIVRLRRIFLCSKRYKFLLSFLFFKKTDTLCYLFFSRL